MVKKNFRGTKFFGTKGKINEDLCFYREKKNRYLENFFVKKINK